MKIGIDSYCYHRFLGGAYPDLERDPGLRLSMFDILDRASALGVDGVSIEACFLPTLEAAFVDELAAGIEARGLDCVWAWGHPNGLHSGAAPEAADDAIAHMKIARRVGARVMRICAGGRRTRPASWPDHRAALLPLLRRMAAAAATEGVVLALENHIDLYADEVVELMEAVDSPWLGVCLDTANNLRMFEDPVAVARKLAPWARAAHVKDVTAQRGDPKTFAFWPSVPLGQGLVDLPAVLGLLRDAGFDGLLALEIDYLSPLYDGEDEAIAESIRWLRDQVRALAPKPRREPAAEVRG